MPPATPSLTRSGFVDLARALAVLMMLQGHTLDVVLALNLRTGPVFDAWTTVRGLTAVMFMLLSGFVFTLATTRHWHANLTSPATIARRLRRFAFFLLLGYALHFPVSRFSQLAGMSDERWRSFAAVDVLQCIAVTLALLQLLVLVSRTPGRWAALAAAAAIAVVAVTPAAWRTEWTDIVPVVVAGYFSPGIGSLFPLLPWSAYLLLGVVLGYAYVRSHGRPADFAWRVLLPGGLALVTAGAVVALLSPPPIDAAAGLPVQVLHRSGVVLLILAAVAAISTRIPRPPSVLHALARESLTIYAVHGCLVYGSVWNDGLRQLVGPTLDAGSAIAMALAMWASMAALAWAWSWCKTHRPVLARVIRAGTFAVLAGQLW